MYQVIIIGAGPAGMTAAIYCIRKGLDTMVICKDIGGQVAKVAEISNWPGVGETTGVELSINFHKHVESFKNIKHKHGVEVKGIKKIPNGFEVVTGDNIFQGETLIITSGRKSRKLGIPGEVAFTNKGVSYCDVCDGPLFKDKNVAIIGGGNSAMDAAIAMSVLSPEVHVIAITPQLTGDALLVNKIHNIKNIVLHLESATKEIVGDTFVTGVVYSDKSGKEKRIDVKGVFIEIGYIPSNDFDTLTAKDEYNRIKIDKNCNTNIEGIFAAGDSTDIRDNQIVIAAGEGAKAALSAFYYLSRKKS